MGAVPYVSELGINRHEGELKRHASFIFSMLSTLGCTEAVTRGTCLIYNDCVKIDFFPGNPGMYSLFSCFVHLVTSSEWLCCNGICSGGWQAAFHCSARL